MNKQVKKEEQENFPPRYGDHKIDDARGILLQLRN
jgi:hypothetical protein